MNRNTTKAGMTPEDGVLLRLRDISATLEHNVVLSKLNFDLRRGELHAILSTRTYDLTNFINLLEGEYVSYDTLPEIFGEKTRFGLIGKNRIDVVRPGASRFDDLSVVENIYLSDIERIRCSKKKERERCQQLLDRFGISINIDQKVGLLTHEKQKMLEMLRIYVNAHPIVVLYEPLSDITSADSNSMMKIMYEMKERGQGIIYVTSRLEDALRIADRVSVLDSGTIKGTFDGDTAARNPKDVLFLLSGWESVKQEPSRQDIDILNSIVNARDIMSSSYELRKELMFLANDIAKVFSASDCTIYVFNSSMSSVADTFDKNGSCNHIRMRNEVLLEVLKSEQMLFMISDDKRFRASFTEPDMAELVKTVACMPVGMKDGVNAVIQVTYDRVYYLTNKDRVYLNAFSKEVAIAVETSNLIGRSTLLKESHHRIKNNLQTIINLVYIQKLYLRRHKDADVDEAFDSIIRRISSIATIHNVLSNEKYVNNINSFRMIIREIIKFYDAERLRFVIDVDDISIPYSKATSLALVVNELISNCTKHAFVNTSNNEIKISCHNDGLGIHMEVADNGVGLSSDFDIEKVTSIGMSVVRSVVQGLGGTIGFHTGRGTTVCIDIPMSGIYRSTAD